MKKSVIAAVIAVTALTAGSAFAAPAVVAEKTFEQVMAPFGEPVSTNVLISPEFGAINGRLTGGFAATYNGIGVKLGAGGERNGRDVGFVGSVRAYPVELLARTGMFGKDVKTGWLEPFVGVGFGVVNAPSTGGNIVNGVTAVQGAGNGINTLTNGVSAVQGSGNVNALGLPTQGTGSNNGSYAALDVSGGATISLTGLTTDGVVPTLSVGYSKLQGVFAGLGVKF